MNLIALGISHNSAAVDVRERVAFAPEQVAEALLDARSLPGVDEIVILSTCNRTELYVWCTAPERTGVEAGASREQDAAETALADSALARSELVNTAARLIEWMAGYHHLSAAELQQCAYHHESAEALTHLIQVASGLDSMVLGEPQIFGQLKSAVVVAQEAGTVGGELNRVFQQVFALAKQVRTDTAIGENPVSVAYAAVDLAGHIYANLSDCRALLVGAGETIELVARHLIEAGLDQIVIANRTLGRARELGQQFGAEAVLLAEIPAQLPAVDVVITSTASQLPILGKGAVEQALKERKHQPFLMIDLAVPRDIEVQVADLRDVYLYSVDDLREIVDENLRSRRSEARKADVLIAEGVAQFLEEQRSLAAVDAVKAFRAQADDLREEELNRALKALARGDGAQQVLAQLARNLTNKLIHAPTTGLKKASVEGRADHLKQACRLLGLDESLANSVHGDASAETIDKAGSASVIDISQRKPR